MLSKKKLFILTSVKKKVESFALKVSLLEMQTSSHFSICYEDKTPVSRENHEFVKREREREVKRKE